MPHRRDPNPPGAPFLPFTRGEQDWGPTHLAEEEMNDSRYADAAIAQLAKKHDRPFLVACGVFHPHMPWYVPQKYFDMFPLDEVDHTSDPRQTTSTTCRRSARPSPKARRSSSTR